MLDLLLDCSVYVAVERGQGNYYQLSGTVIGHMWKWGTQTEHLELIAYRNPID